MYLRVALLFFAVGGFFMFSSCKKEEVSTSVNDVLSFSTDTLAFDTVFSSVGSSTRIFKVYNPNDKSVIISEVKVGAGVSSIFRLNLNGKSGVTHSNVEVRAKDSLWVFVEVTVNPGVATTPFLVEDFLEFTTNGVSQVVTLNAYGKNAVFHKPATGQKDVTLKCNEVWDSSIPHVIFGRAILDSNCTLLIEEGAEVYFHAEAKLIVRSGAKLQITGSKDLPVTFEGDRLESWYENVPGQWGGIVLEEGSIDHVISFLKLKNAQVGITISGVASSEQVGLKMDNTVVFNCLHQGLVLNNTSAKLLDVLIGNCGKSALLIESGGPYEFIHSTFANYVSATDNGTTNESVLIKNWKTVDDVLVPEDLTQCDFKNCIVYGSLENTLVFSDQGTIFNYSFTNCILKERTKGAASPASYVSCIWNADPKFVYTGDLDFNLGEGSSAIGKGEAVVVTADLADLEFDLNGVSRLLGIAPDAGVFQYFE